MSGPDKEYQSRSPLFHLEAAKGLPIDIGVGIHDGHKGGSVPISHSLRAFNTLAAANKCEDKLLKESEIVFMTEREQIPRELFGEKENDSERRRAILFRRVAGPVRITVFEGGHEGEYTASYKWLARQQKGKSVVWRPENRSVGVLPGTDNVNQVAR